MSFKYSVSALALATALVAAPPVLAQLDISVGGDEGLNVGVDLDTDDGLNVGADVGVGDESGVNAGVDANVGGDDGLIGVDVDTGLPGSANQDSLVEIGADAEVNLSTGRLGGSLLDLSGDERTQALLSLVARSNLAGVDLDAQIDDSHIIIVDIGDSFGEDVIAEVELAVSSGEAAGIEDTRAAVSASVALSSVLSGNGLSTDDVIALELGDEGETYVYVLGDLEDGVGTEVNADLAGTGLADAEIGPLRDGTEVDADVNILPGNGGGEEPLVDLGEGDLVDADISLADEDAVADVQISALRRATSGEGDGVEADLDVALGDQQTAQANLGVLDQNLLSGDLVVLPGGGDDAGDGGTGGGGGTGGDGGGTGDSGGDAGGGGDDAGAGSRSGSSGGTGTVGEGRDTAAATETPAPATMPCPADIRGFLETTASGAELEQTTTARVVLLTGCDLGGLFQSANFERLRAAISGLAHTRAAIEASPADIDDVVSVTVAGEVATIYALQ